jgi:hypothetical protein
MMSEASTSRSRFMVFLTGALIPMATPCAWGGCANNSKALRIRKRYEFRNIDPANYATDDEIIVRSILAALVRADAADPDWKEHSTVSIKKSSDRRIEFELRQGMK